MALNRPKHVHYSVINSVGRTPILSCCIHKFAFLGFSTYEGSLTSSKPVVK